jgi:predicted AAA+ superfamily ATPase
MNMLPRKELFQAIMSAINRAPVTLLLGARQCGKTTIAREIHRYHGGTFFDLEDPETPLKQDMAKIVLRELTGLVVIDEFQRQPALFPILRVLVDRQPQPARFLVLGSSSLDLVRGISESLAGRVSYVNMGGLTLQETGAGAVNDLWLRGGFPRALLAENEESSFSWRHDFIRSFLERDIPQFGIRIPADTLRRFWMMTAHIHGQVWNAADLARSLGAKEDTARKYLDILSGAFMIRQVSPWFENIGKRLVKSPKVFIRDSGILHALLGIKTIHQIQSHHKLGSSWEGFAMEQVIRSLAADGEVFFYKTHSDAELDLLLERDGKRYGFEFKYMDAPRTTKAMHIVLQDLKLEKLWVVYPGDLRYPIAEKIEVIPLSLIGNSGDSILNS